jgi:hypothetical protein
MGESYLRLLRGTRERVWAAEMPELLELRRAQASAALNRAVVLKPDLAQAHLSLFSLYAERDLDYRDLALQHLRAYLKRVPRDSRMQEAEVGLAKAVAEANARYAKESAGLTLMDRALLARDLHLAGKARDLLLESHRSAFGERGVALELELMLKTGRAREVRDWTAPDPGQEQLRTDLGGPAYHLLRARALAACGDYATARGECRRLAQAVIQGDAGEQAVSMRAGMTLMIAQALLDEQPGGTSLPYLLWRAYSPFGRMGFRERVRAVARNLRREADATTLRGLLALEQGAVDEAATAFREALALWRDATSAASGATLDFNGRRLAQECLRWLE